MVADGCLCGVAMARFGLHWNEGSYVRYLWGVRLRVERCRGLMLAYVRPVECAHRSCAGARFDALA